LGLQSRRWKPPKAKINEKAKANLDFKKEIEEETEEDQKWYGMVADLTGEENKS
jgi:hypothetical protein